jgi:hypothetical protein
MSDLNFDTYEIMRLAEMPKVETVIVPTYDFWGGVGEPTNLRGGAGECQRHPQPATASRCAACH